MDCRTIQEKLTFYIYDELSLEERTGCDKHVAECSDCRAALESLRGTQRLLSERAVPELQPELLVECRRALDEVIDREELGWQGLFHRWREWLRARSLPEALSALGFVLFGFGLGWGLRPHAAQIRPANPGISSSSIADSDLNNLRVRSISQVAPDPQTGAVKITMDAEKRMTIEGSLDNPRIRQFLVDAVKRYDNPGIRLDTLDALRTRANNPPVRSAVLFAMRNDPNVGIRLEALRSAAGLECTDDLHPALLQALEHDQNVGVRITALDVLVEHGEKEGPDPEVMSVLQRLATNDSNPYVRMKCIRAVRVLEGLSR